MAQPGLVGQLFDTMAEAANDIQVWNEELSPSRRHVILRVDAEDQIARVKVVNGEERAQLDTTGTLKPDDACLKRRRIALVFVTTWLSGRATGGSDACMFKASPSVVEHGREFRARAAGELALLPEG